MERERLDHDVDEIDHCVEVDDDDAIVCEKPKMKVFGLLGAPMGWSLSS